MHKPVLLGSGQAVPLVSPSGLISQPAHDFDDRSRDLWGGISLFAATGRGSRILALGDRADAFASVARWFGGEVVCLDMKQGPGSADESAPPLFPLPFGEAEFDTLFLSEILEWSDRWAVQGEGPNQAQCRLLRECMRVLRPGGILLALVDNRFSIANWGGKRHPTTGMRGFEILPRVLTHLLPPKLKRQTLRYQAESFSGWERTFRSVGLFPEKWRTLLPSKIEWNHVATLSALPDRALAGASGSRKELLADSLLRGLQRVAAHHLASPNFLITSRKPGRHAHVQAVHALYDELLEAEGESTDAEVIVSRFNNSKSFSFVAGKTFFKVPVTRHSITSIEKEVRASKIIAGYPVSPHVPGPARLCQLKGVHYLACPAIEVDRTRTFGESHLREVLDLLGRGARQVSLSHTQFWQRCFHPDLYSRLGELGGRPVLHYVQNNLADRQVAAGLVHNDLHLQNILLSKDRVHIIDWNRLEENSPRFLDLMELVTSFLMDRLPGMQDRIPETLEILVTRGPKASVLDRIYDWEDELSISEMSVCYILSYVGFLYTNRKPSTADQRRFQPWFSFCERALGSA